MKSDIPFNADPSVIVSYLQTASGINDIEGTKTSKPYIDGVEYFITIKKP